MAPPVAIPPLVYLAYIHAHIFLFEPVLSGWVTPIYNGEALNCPHFQREEEQHNCLFGQNSWLSNVMSHPIPKGGG